MKTNMTIRALQAAYAEGSITPAQVMESIRQRATEYEDRNIWVHLLSAEG